MNVKDPDLLALHAKLIASPCLEAQQLGWLIFGLNSIIDRVSTIETAIALKGDAAYGEELAALIGLLIWYLEKAGALDNLE